MEKTQPVTIVSDRVLLTNLLPAYVENNYSFALWRLPDTTTLHLAACESSQEWSDNTLEDAPPGFIFSPFDPTQKKIFLPAEDLYTFDGGLLTSSKGNGPPKSRAHDTTDQRVVSYFSNGSASPTVPGPDPFKALVVLCKDEILRGNAEKIVPSRTKNVDLPSDFNLLDSFQRLCDAYPHAMVSIVSGPHIGTWMGATPEMLVRVNKDQIFHTVAIAGTQAFHEGTDLRSISWNQKEIEEQVLVVRYIISCFKKIRLREYEERGPKTIVAGNVLHLKTEFEVDMVATNFPQLGTIMLQLLHPTSAVCGMPLETTLNFLKQHEGYDRQFYSGYLGPVNIFQESNLYVNLRCMQLFENQAILYAGAGVLSDSDPETEWHETEMKMNTLLRIIKK